MMIISNRTYVTEEDIDHAAVADVSERTRLPRADVRAVIVAYLNAAARREEDRREFNRNGQDRW